MLVANHLPEALLAIFYKVHYQELLLVIVMLQVQLVELILVQEAE